MLGCCNSEYGFDCPAQQLMNMKSIHSIHPIGLLNLKINYILLLINFIITIYEIPFSLTVFYWLSCIIKYIENKLTAITGFSLVYFINHVGNIEICFTKAVFVLRPSLIFSDDWQNHSWTNSISLMKIWVKGVWK